MTKKRALLERRLRYLWNKVAKAEELHPDFTLTLTRGTDGWVRYAGREAQVGIDGPAPKRLLLHEMAHALIPKQKGNGHTIKWYLLYARLLCTYLKCTPPDESDLIAFGTQMDWM